MEIIPLVVKMSGPLILVDWAECNEKLSYFGVVKNTVLNSIVNQNGFF